VKIAISPIASRRRMGEVLSGQPPIYAALLR
jgi:hypothetical protein